MQQYIIGLNDGLIRFIKFEGRDEINNCVAFLGERCSKRGKYKINHYTTWDCSDCVFVGYSDQELMNG